MTITIRKANVGDSQNIVKMLKSIAAQHYVARPDIFIKNAAKYTNNDVEQLIKTPGTIVLVADLGSGAVGYIIMQEQQKGGNGVLRRRKTLYIDDLFVQKKYRKLGVGKALMDTAMSYAQKNNFYNVELNVWEQNFSALNFYKDLGFTTQRRIMEKTVD